MRRHSPKGPPRGECRCEDRAAHGEFFIFTRKLEAIGVIIHTYRPCFWQIGGNHERERNSGRHTHPDAKDLTILPAIE
jgi:hypothetical protein